MVLGIVVTAVDAIQRTSSELKFDTAWQVLKRHVLLLGNFYSGCRISAEAGFRGGAAVAAAARGTTVPLTYSMRYERWKQDYATRYTAVLNAKRWVESGEKEVHLSELNLILNSVPMSMRRVLYTAACEAYSTKKALRATRSRTVDEVESATRQIEKQLALLERKLDLAPPPQQKIPNGSRKRKDEEDEDAGVDKSDDEDPDIRFEKYLKGAVRSKGGVAEMLMLTRSNQGFLSKDSNNI